LPVSANAKYAVLLLSCQKKKNNPVFLQKNVWYNAIRVSVPFDHSRGVFTADDTSAMQDAFFTQKFARVGGHG